VISHHDNARSCMAQIVHRNYVNLHGKFDHTHLILRTLSHWINISGIATVFSWHSI
ncbi:hypothetical protein WH47_06070, partial [Habropoda laboriosa]